MEWVRKPHLQHVDELLGHVHPHGVHLLTTRDNWVF